MIRILFCLILLSLTLSAQNRKISLRTLCFRHAYNVKEVFLATGSAKKTVFTKATLYTSTYSDPITLTITDNALGVALPVEVSKKYPDGYQMFATKKIGLGKRQLAIFIPTTNPKKPYRLTIIDEGEQNFPMGSTLIYNLSNTDFRMTIGEHLKVVKPLKQAKLPLPKKINALNQATVRTYRKNTEGNWMIISSTVWKTSDKLRGLAIAYIHPLTKKPVVDYFQETPPWRLPKLE
jgi:hypothetical protein